MMSNAIVRNFKTEHMCINVNCATINVIHGPKSEQYRSQLKESKCKKRELELENRNTK